MKYVFSLIISFSAFPLSGQSFDEAEVRRQLEEMNRIEQAAFIEGDCNKLISLMSDSIEFYANGMKPPSKQVIYNFCANLPRPFPGTPDVQTRYFVLSETSGYLVNELTIPRKDGMIQKEYVTKIWNKEGEEWKLTHLHSTVKIEEKE